MPGRFLLLIGADCLFFEIAACVPVTARRVRRVIVSSVDDAINGDVRIDVTGCISYGKYMSQDTTPGAISAA
ncbi:hypothetical protein BI49514_03131 [Brevibacterium iodinum ATCC 49514]|uniref:Uncharacterized protein n=1 Tax=Brevibacterium iodinum ATCC 49514 TaxID=1255616 RepID=A0A2H1KM58_9MICO|nr:hypothetical protein BI49514_03131 [Brevibacterium iodinum ATCC 49514]SUW70212.1 Uncharacterised protein [Brevibacterium iodinum]